LHLQKTAVTKLHAPLQQQKTAAGNLAATCSSKKQSQESSLQPAAAKKQENTSLHFFQNEVGGRCRNIRAVGSFIAIESLSNPEATRK